MAHDRLAPPRTLVPAERAPSRDTPPDGGVTRQRGRRWSLELFRAAYDRLGHDNGDGLAAGLAFGALLSIAPLLLVVLAISSAVLGDDESRAQLDRLVGDSLGQPAVEMIRDWVEQAHAWSGTATMLGLVMFLIGSARLVALVDAAFEMVFDVERREAPTSFVDRAKAYLGAQARTIAVTMAAGLLMVASLVLRAIGEWVFGGIESAIVEALWIVGREVVSLAMWMAALVLVYWALPPIRLRTADIVQGAFVSAVLVELALIALRIGAGFFDPGAAYGTAGAVVGLLVTLFLVGELFLYGAELTAELSSRGGLSVRSSRDGCPKRIAPTAALGRGLRR